MSTPDTLDEVRAEVKELLRQMEELNQLAGAMARDRGRRPRLMFPFSMIDRMINWGLRALERLVGRMVKAVIH